jgi:hypothetical protein
MHVQAVITRCHLVCREVEGYSLGSFSFVVFLRKQRISLKFCSRTEKSTVFVGIGAYTAQK